MKTWKSVGVAAVAVVAMAVIAACEGGFVERGGGPLALTLSVTPLNALVGDSILVETAAVGTSLAGTIIDFGDGRVDSIGASGAVTQEVRIVDHFYTSAGSFVITARVEDDTQGAAVRTATVEVVNP